MKIEGTLIHPDGKHQDVIYDTDFETVYIPDGYTLVITGGGIKNTKIEFDNEGYSLKWWKP